MKVYIHMKLRNQFLRKYGGFVSISLVNDFNDLTPSFNIKKVKYNSNMVKKMPLKGNINFLENFEKRSKNREMNALSFWEEQNKL